MKNENRERIFISNMRRRFRSLFDRFFGIFKELITHTSGDFDEELTGCVN
jgi:hypothetical protein